MKIDTDTATWWTAYFFGVLSALIVFIVAATVATYLTIFR